MDSATAFGKVVGHHQAVREEHGGLQRGDRQHADHRGPRRELGAPGGHHPGVRGRVRDRGGRRLGRQGADARRRGPDDPAEDGDRPTRRPPCCQQDRASGCGCRRLVSQIFVLLTYHSLEAWMRFRRYRILDLRPGARRVRGARAGPARAAAGLRQPPDAHRLADHPVGAGAGLAAVRAAGLVLLEPAGQVQHVDEPVRQAARLFRQVRAGAAQGAARGGAPGARQGGVSCSAAASRC